MTIRRIPATRLGRLALTAGTALALFTTLPMSSAHATTGTLFYSSSVGDFQIKEPPLRTCEPLHGGATNASNQTNATATLYFDSSCGSPWGSLQPGKFTSFVGDLPDSVRFGS
ncbi:hypothetical protein [Streptomyces klenkii]|uniref:hypothetical protein n=1 Tax=Streptomyces klenkii TaxID=1420899 RepID=UPI0034278740